VLDGLACNVLTYETVTASPVVWASARTFFKAMPYRSFAHGCRHRRVAPQHPHAGRLYRRGRTVFSQIPRMLLTRLEFPRLPRLPPPHIPPGCLKMSPACLVRSPMSVVDDQSRRQGVRHGHVDAACGPRLESSA